MAKNSTPKTLNSFYASSRWMKLRAALIAERGPRCEQCGKLERDPSKLTGHHMIDLTPENVGDASISLNPKYIKIVCRDCHDAVHQRFGHENTGRQVYLVYGMPGSGKSTYVQQYARRGDLIVDMDLLYQAVSGLPMHNKPDVLLSNVYALYDLLLDQVKSRYGKWYNAFIVGGFPDRWQREKLADDLGAELIFCDATREECINRILNDPVRSAMHQDYIGYIDRWIEKYQP